MYIILKMYIYIYIFFSFSFFLCADIPKPSRFSIRLQPQIENPEWDSSAKASKNRVPRPKTMISGIGLGTQRVKLEKLGGLGLS